MNRATARAIELAKAGSVTPMQMQVFAAIKATGNGASRKEIVAATGFQAHYASTACIILKHSGHIVLVSFGRTARWCLPGQEDAAIKRAEELDKPVQATAEEQAKRIERKLIRTIKAKDRARRPLEDTPTVTVVDAAKAKPFKVYAPRSIFELATC